MQNSDLLNLKVCKSGHILTSNTKTMNKSIDYCYKCGSPIIAECSQCGKYLQSPFSISDITQFQYCIHCGKPHPWNKQANK